MPERQIAGLVEELKRAATRTNEQWMASLDERKRAELEFHDKCRDPNGKQVLPQDTYEMLHGNKKYYSTVALSREFVTGWIKRHAEGRVFLDYACGNGENALAAARSGAALAIGIDISSVSVENCRRKAQELGLESNTFFLQGDCENTGLPAGSIDTVICSGMLHHLDLSYAFPELRRVMKAGATCLGVEALNINPIIKAYRLLTPSMRTDWEKSHILGPKDLTFARRFFDVHDVRYWHLLSIGATPLRNTPLFETALGVANGLDRVLLRVPGFAQLAWMFTFELVRRRD